MENKLFYVSTKRSYDYDLQLIVTRTENGAYFLLIAKSVLFHKNRFKNTSYYIITLTDAKRNNNSS